MNCGPDRADLCPDSSSISSSRAASRSLRCSQHRARHGIQAKVGRAAVCRSRAWLPAAAAPAIASRLRATAGLRSRRAIGSSTLEPQFLGIPRCSAARDGSAALDLRRSRHEGVPMAGPFEGESRPPVDPAAPQLPSFLPAFPGRPPASDRRARQAAIRPALATSAGSRRLRAAPSRNAPSCAGERTTIAEDSQYDARTPVSMPSLRPPRA